MNHFVRFNKETGRIDCVGFASILADAEAMKDDENDILLDAEADDLTQYVKAGKVVDRPTLDIPQAYTMQADGVEKLTIPVPANTTVSFLGQTAELSDKKIEFMTDQPGNYEIEIEPPFPTMPVKVTISAF